jgi:uncharacterized protein YdiU (UPF0061 family)
MSIVLPPNFAGLKFDNTYARLPSHFYSHVDPTPAIQPGLVKINHPLAEELGLNPQELASSAGVQMLAGNAIPPGAEPLAQAYTGHQFGYLNRQLGDGRAILLGEVIDKHQQRRDIQLKGPGRTPYSRSGDGRAALGPVLREYLVSDAMYHLGIKTTRALAAVTTGEFVYRESALPGAVLTRVAASHIRIGTFEYFRVRDDKDGLKSLADYAIQRHYPQVVQGAQVAQAAQTAQIKNPYSEFLRAVMDAQAKLVASWLHVGFIHGVMNTDNMSISGETIDYGPCAFMDVYDPTTVFSSIDQGGRYAYGNQGSIALWNLARLAECLLPLFHEDTNQAVAIAESVLGEFSDLFNEYWLAGMREKIGLTSMQEGDQQLITDLLQLMHDGRADFTLAFRHLADCTLSPTISPSFRNLFDLADEPLVAWLQSWSQRLAIDGRDASAASRAMNGVNPLYIPRNYLVEKMLNAAVVERDYGLFEEMLRVLSRPFEEQPGMEQYATCPPLADASYKTFCGT